MELDIIGLCILMHQYIFIDFTKIPTGSDTIARWVTVGDRLGPLEKAGKKSTQVADAVTSTGFSDFLLARGPSRTSVLDTA